MLELPCSYEAQPQWHGNSSAADADESGVTFSDTACVMHHFELSFHSPIVDMKGGQQSILVQRQYVDVTQYTACTLLCRLEHSGLAYQC